MENGKIPASSIKKDQITKNSKRDSAVIWNIKGLFTKNNHEIHFHSKFFHKTKIFEATLRNITTSSRLPFT